MSVYVYECKAMNPMFYNEWEKINHISYLILYVLFLSSDHKFLAVSSIRYTCLPWIVIYLRNIVY